MMRMPVAPVMSARSRCARRCLGEILKRDLFRWDGPSWRAYARRKRHNICKLYRATRCGPESDIDPKEQLMLFGLLADLPTARLPVSEATFSANGVGA
jgi:hypothetical protein